MNISLIILMNYIHARGNSMKYTVKVNVSNNWFIRCSTADLKQANQQADKMRKQGFQVKLERKD